MRRFKGSTFTMKSTEMLYYNLILSKPRGEGSNGLVRRERLLGRTHAIIIDMQTRIPQVLISKAFNWLQIMVRVSETV
jgi:hypothetical protein